MKVSWAPAELLPEPREVLAAQGVPPGAPVSPRVERLVDDALALLAGSAEPVGLVKPVSQQEFASVLVAAERNAPDPVIGFVHPGADALALFAGTVGARVSRRIEDLFDAGEHALAASLDAGASRMAERVADALGGALWGSLAERTRGGPDVHVVGYSPGYCGWHVTGQRPLFARLRPERIGITLNDACLMDPLKSVSGVLVAGSAEIHTFEMGFTFCAACRDRSCVARMRSLEGDAGASPDRAVRTSTHAQGG